MKVIHVIASLGHAGAGPAYTVSRLAHGLSQLQVHLQVHTLMPVPRRSSAAGWVIAYPLDPMLPRLGMSAAMRRGLGAADADILHNNGLWMMPNIYAGMVAHRQRVPLVCSPHGMFSEWAMAFSRWRKQVAWWALGQRRAAAVTSCFHAACASEARDIRRLGFRQPIAVVPHGIDPPEQPMPVGRALAAPEKDRKTVLFLGRLHPKKGLPNLLRAWRDVRRDPEAADWTLLIAGWDQDGHQRELERLAAALTLGDSLRFVGPRFDHDKAASLAGADAFVLPSLSEGLPVAVLEAWSYGLPVLMTAACNLPEGFAAGAALPIGADPAAIAAGLRRLFALSDAERQAMGARGRALVRERFCWRPIAEDMKAVYAWVLGGGPPPSCVMTD